jgi:hypothetical protein
MKLIYAILIFFIIISSGTISKTGIHPEILSYYPGVSTTYVYIGTPIPTDKPIQFYLANDSKFLGERLSISSTKDAFITSMQVWNYFSDKKVFNTEIILDPNKKAGYKDGYNVIEFDNLGSGTLGLCYRWTYEDGHIETDLKFNTNSVWVTDFAYARTHLGRCSDLQSIALHEMGHSMGLGDIYNLPIGDPRKRDLTSIMTAFATPRHLIGKGDITGIKKMYK